MSTHITLPQGYHYVIAAMVSASWVPWVQSTVVARFRRKAGIKYPQAYAEKAETEASTDAHKFNCAQRAHQHTLEVLPILSISTLVAGLKYPILAASGCVVWSVSRFFFTQGYVTGTPGNRFPGGAISSVAMVVLNLAATYTTGQFILAGL